MTKFFKNVSIAVTIAVASNSYAQVDTEVDAETDIIVSKVSVTDNRQDERDVIAQMAKAGYSNFVLLSKKNAKLYLVQDGQFLLETRIIFGRGHGSKNLTPSGVFSLTNVFKGESKPEISFYIDDRVIYLIHGMVPGREAALKIDNMNARQLSEGCVNVPDQILPLVSDFARDIARANPTQQATPFVVMDVKYNIARFQKILQKFVPEQYNPD